MTAQNLLQNLLGNKLGRNQQVKLEHTSVSAARMYPYRSISRVWKLTVWDLHC